jgi:hypothetical protein
MSSSTESSGSHFQILDTDTLPTGVLVNGAHGSNPTAFFNNVEVSVPVVGGP